jgi:hypothetical protein
LSALSGDSTILLQLPDLFFELLAGASQFFEIGPLDLLQCIGIRTLLPFVRRTVMTIAALMYASTQAFRRNSQDVIERGRMITFYTDGLHRFGRWDHAIVMCLLIEKDTSELLEVAIDAFGCRKWLESDGEVSEINGTDWLPPCLLCRFLIALMSDFFAEEGFDESRFVRKSMNHRLKLGPVSTSDIQLQHRWSELVKLCLSGLREVGSPISVDVQRKYWLKPEFENSASPFWILYTVPEFLEQVSLSTNSRPPSLVPIPGISTTIGDRLICQTSFTSFIFTSVHIAVAHSADYSPALLHCFLALINMIDE